MTSQADQNDNHDIIERVLEQRKPLAATQQTLTKVLAQQPILWVGAGLSLAAGYPSMWTLVEALRALPEDEIPEGLEFTALVDAVIAAVGKGEVSDELADLFAQGGGPTEIHRSIASLARAGCFAAIITTNYDTLLEDALRAEGASPFVQTLEQNANVRTPDGSVRLLKIHGSQEDWQEVILSGTSYEDFNERYDFLTKQLDVLLPTHPLLFLGYSMQDPRLLEWLAQKSQEEADRMKRWRPMLTEADWRAALSLPWGQGIAADSLFLKGNIRLLRVDDYGQPLSDLWRAVANEIAPAASLWSVLNIHVDEKTWSATLDGCEAWEIDATSLQNQAFVKLLRQLRALSCRPFPTDERGQFLAAHNGDLARLQKLAKEVGSHLTEVVLSAEAQQRLQQKAQQAREATCAIVHLRVSVAEEKGALHAAADHILALPWELLVIDDVFPVEQGCLEVLRDAVVPGLSGLTEAPKKELSIVAAVAAPLSQTSLDYEGECYRLWQALGEEEQRLLITDRGTVDDFVESCAYHQVPVVHFTGHGAPGELLFEDRFVEAVRVPVRDLTTQLRAKVEVLPSLFYLASCHGNSFVQGALPGEPVEHVQSREALVPRQMDEAADNYGTPSTAATLHRAGFAQVVAYFGPVGDEQSTRAEAHFYHSLNQGELAWKALRDARLVSKKPIERGGRLTHRYPLGWSQLVLYHRGQDLPTTREGRQQERSAALFEEERKRRIHRLDREGGERGVSRLLHGFVGRRQERATLMRVWEQGERVKVVVGLGGLGKTTLCAEMLLILARVQSKSQEPVSVLVLDARGAEQEQDPLAFLWRQVSAFDPDKEGWDAASWAECLGEIQKQAQDAAAEGVEVLADVLVAAIREASRRCDGLLVYLDDTESLLRPIKGRSRKSDFRKWRNEGLQHFWSSLCALVEEDDAKRLGLLASSRYLPAETDDRHRLSLDKMRDVDMIRLLRWYPVLGQLSHSDTVWLASEMQGLPRAVDFLEELALRRSQELAEAKEGPGARYHGNAWRQEIVEPLVCDGKVEDKISADLMLKQLWDVLKKGERTHLAKCAVLSQPAPWPTIVHLGQKKTAEALLRTGLLSPSLEAGKQERWWMPHPVVFSLFKEEDWIEAQEAAHRSLGEWWQEKLAEDWEPQGALCCVEHWLAIGEGNLAWESAHRVVLSFRRAGRFRDALALVESVLEAKPSDASLGLALTFRVQLERRSGRPSPDAEDLLEQAFTLVDEKEQGLVAHEHGALLQAQGDLVGARERLEQSFAIERRVRGTEEHPDVAASLHALASVLEAQGDLDGAREMLEQSLAIDKRIYGTEEHPDVAGSLHALAGVMRAQGDLVGAREKLEQSLAIDKRIYGTEEHPSVAASLHELARVMQAQGDLVGARARLEQSLAIDKRIYGTEEHPDVAASLHALAGVMQAQGDLVGARARLEQSLAIQRRIHGTEEHPSVAASLHSLAVICKAEGKPEEACTILEQVLSIESRIYGSRDHYVTAQTEEALGMLLLEMGKVQEGLALLAHALQVFRVRLGEEHSSTQELFGFFVQLMAQAENSSP